ncbi:NnrS family protein [Sulfuriroseicoccus oceanibius]|uniref:NnrS family protein n=1 Tax=Sulfuriroseicoccus oceanibius TaxID=2707525 RepID=A0A7T7F2X7_9BACT|nr:NnrS family protein [Sulfuriroseicoccus oceanibius]QQL45703.1 NnrS family protein [Sulfuriroseicoccus oceanibius]
MDRPATSDPNLSSAPQPTASSRGGRCAARRARLAQAPFRELLLAEPYRWFFPLAVLIGIAAVLLWPAFYQHWIDYQPKTSHARLMIQGFIGGFAFGFLGTAIPKVLNTHRFFFGELATFATAYLASSGFHLANRTVAGDAFFLIALVTFMISAGTRAALRKDLPPPGFLLVGAGMLCGISGTVLFLSGHALEFNATREQWAGLLLYQGFMLLPLIGIGAFLFPRFFKTDNKQIFPSNPYPTEQWTRRAKLAGTAAALIILSFFLEVEGIVRWGAWLRAATCFAYLASETGFWKRSEATGVLPAALRTGLICLIIAALAAGWVQANRIALDHILYIGGLGLIALVVGTRVLYGHAGRTKAMGQWLIPLCVVFGLILIAMVLRVTADFTPQVKTAHYLYSALVWAAATTVWAIAMAPLLIQRRDP